VLRKCERCRQPLRFDRRGGQCVRLPGGMGHMSMDGDGAIRGEGDVFQVLDVLANKAKVRAVFSDWPATTTYFSNCVRLD